MELTPWPFPIAPRLDTDITEAVLANGELEALGSVPWSSNAAIITQITHDNQHVTAVCKPQAGERPLIDFPEGTLCRREVAAYQLAKLMGMTCIPETVLRDTPWGTAAVQRFIPHHPDTHFFTIREQPAHHHSLRQMALFDIVANNTDRKGGHVLVELSDDPVPELRGIDHGLTFHLQWKLRTVIWDYQGQPWSSEETVMLQQLLQHDLTELHELLSPLERDAIHLRAEAALALGMFPVPKGDHREVPWPLV